MRGVRISILSCLVLLGACSSGSADDPAADAMPDVGYEQGRQTECHGLCAGYEHCGFMAPTCDADCLDGYNPVGVRGSVLEAIGACMQDDDCDSLGSDDPSAACFARVEAAEPLRQAVVDYCESATLAWFRCDSWWPVEECATSMSIWQDDVLEHARSCHPKSCQDLDTCEDQIFNPLP